MFERLQKKWKVSPLQLALILITFAVGGSLTGYVGRRLMSFFAIEQKWLWVFIYIILVTLLWPLAVLLVSIFTGQFRFFTGYIKKIGTRIGIGKSRESGIGSQKSIPHIGKALLTIHHSAFTNIAIFASGAGSNAQKIIDYFRNSSSVKISLILCNKPDAGVLKIAAQENIPSIIIDKEKFFHGNSYIDELKERKIDLVVLAGFLWKLPADLIRVYPGSIINIHPALLPKYGGKGMYGNNVHTAVIAAGEKESGITIHYVDEHYDNGDIIFQAKCPIVINDTPDSLAERIHKLEHQHFPQVIEKLIRSKKS